MAIDPVTLKALIDTQITNETVDFAITPAEVGERMKDSIDYTTEQIELKMQSTGGTQCIIVNSFGTPQENGIALQAAYNAAKTRTPNGLPLSATNRVTIALTSGTYTPPVRFTIDTQYIDVVSLTGNRDVILTNGIFVQANDVYLKGIDVLTNAFDIGFVAWGDPLVGYHLLKCENCKGGNLSFGGNAYDNGYTALFDSEENWINDIYDVGNIVVSGTFINCIGGNNSFGGNLQTQGNASMNITGTFINCKATSGFGLGELIQAGNNYSFVSGLFIDCETTGTFSKGGFVFLTGTFNNCKGNNESFGGFESRLTGVFNNCTGGFSVIYGLFSGIFNNCKGSFNADESYLSGTFNNCIGGSESFQSFNGYISGIFNNCIGGFGSFGGTNAIVSGTFNNCIGGASSFGRQDWGNSLTGKLYYCRLTSGTFLTVSESGRTIYCIDGNGDPNNQ